MNKTFSEFLANNTDFWDNHSGYPSAVQSIVDDWFYYREICVNNDTKFRRMFGRKLDVLENQFQNFYNNSMSYEFNSDPTVLEHIERTISNVKSSQGTDALTRETTGTNANTRTLNTTHAKTGTEVLDDVNVRTDALQDLRTLATSLAKTGTETTDTDASRTDARQTQRTINTEHKKTGTTSVATDETKTNNLQDQKTLNTQHTKTGTEDTATTDTGTVSNAGTATRTQYNSDYPQSNPTLAASGYLSTGLVVDDVTSDTRTDNKAGSSDTTFNTTEGNTGTETDAHTGTVVIDNDAVTTHNTTDKETGTITDTNSGTLTDDITAETTFNTTDTESGTVTDAHTGTATNDRDATTTFNTSEADTGTVGDSGTTSENVTANTTTSASENGSLNESTYKRGAIVEVFDKYFSIIKKTNAISWLLDKLDVCFVQVFEEDEEESSESGGNSEEIAELERQVRQLTATVDSILAGNAGVTRIFTTYAQMVAAQNTLPFGTTCYVLSDENEPLPYLDSGAGINVTQLVVNKPNGDAETINVTVNDTIERLSPEFNPELYTYMAQFWALPSDLSKIYDNYTLKNAYGNTVYTYYSYDSENPFYSFEINFEPAPARDYSDTYWSVNSNGDLIKLEV